MMNSADALVRAPVGREAFPGAKLIEHGSMSGEHLSMKMMVEAIDALGRRRGRNPAAATGDERAIAERFETSRDWQRRLGSGGLGDVGGAELGAHGGGRFQHHAIFSLELIKAPEDQILH